MHTDTAINVLRVSLRERFLFFGRNSGIHGLNHLFLVNASLISRLFWLAVIIASAGCLYLMLSDVDELGTEASFTIDTRYVHWTTMFPAVTVCETAAPKLVMRKFISLYPSLTNTMAPNLQRYLADQLYGRGSCQSSICVPCGKLVDCDVPWRDIIETVHKNCKELLTECSYNGVAFPCCTHFVSVDSEYGPCFAFNTLQRQIRGDLFTVNRTTGPGVLSFRLLSDAQVSIHSPEELSTNNLDNKLKFKLQSRVQNRADVIFSVIELENDPKLQTQGTPVRGCRYLNEIPDEKFHTYPVYSYSACRLACSTEDSFRRCGCVHPVRDPSYRNMYCNYTGLNFWAIYEDEKVRSNAKINDKGDECLPSCVETEVTIIHMSKYWEPKDMDEGVRVNIKMASLPTLRYRRDLIRDNLDIVVSVAGMVGLFFSASILSMVEILYLLSRKPPS